VAIKFWILLLTLIMVALAGAQTRPERFWLAGRYDTNRFVVYFEAVKMHGSIPAAAEKLPCPVTVGFFCPVKLSANYLAQFQKAPNAERFALGDRYDLIVGVGTIVPVTLTTLVGFQSDEQVGNDSYIGALATVEKGREDTLYLAKSYLAVRRHREADTATPLDVENPASMPEEPIQFDLQTRMVTLLTGRKQALNHAQPQTAGTESPVFEVQRFRLADGGPRYYARAGWSCDEGPRENPPPCAFGAWLTEPGPRILAVDSAFYYGVLPVLLNVVDLGAGRTGLIVALKGADSSDVRMVEYRDGVDFYHMRVLQSIGAGE
jgi:hypothetical protein